MICKIQQVKKGALRRHLLEIGFLPGKQIKVEYKRYMVIVHTSYSSKYSMNRKDFEKYMVVDQIFSTLT